MATQNVEHPVNTRWYQRARIPSSGAWGGGSVSRGAPVSAVTAASQRHGPNDARGLVTPRGGGS